MTEPTPLLPSDPKANFLAHKDEINAAIARVLESGRYILGEEVAAFENEFAAYIGVRFGIGVDSGTDALNLALRACRIREGDEVITVSHTATATVAAIELCGATPVLIDIEANAYTMDSSQVEKAITKATKAVIPVHLYGHPADIDSISSIARRNNLVVIEDCAQSHGATCGGRATGAWGDIAAFSFYPTKNLGAIGDGGMVVTDNSALAERVRMLREYGWRSRYISEFPGLNARLDELQAAILRVKLHYLDKENRKRRELAEIYERVLSTTNSVTLPGIAPNATHVYHQYVIRSKRRDELRQFLLDQGIGTLIQNPVPLHQQPAYRERLRCVGPMVNTETVAKELLSLPMYPELAPGKVQQIAETIRSWAQGEEE